MTLGTVPNLCSLGSLLPRSIELSLCESAPLKKDGFDRASFFTFYHLSAAVMAPDVPLTFGEIEDRALPDVFSCASLK